MHAFLISNLPDDRRALTSNSPDVLLITPETSIGIEEVRQAQAFLAKRPIKEKKNRVYFLNAHLLTIPAQHALLKTLEEPPGESEIFLITTQPDTLLPTILSRVDSKRSEQALGVDEEKISAVVKIITALGRVGVGEALALVDRENFTRETAREFLNNLEQLLHRDLNLKFNYSEIHRARKYLKANVNVKLIMDHLFLNLLPNSS